MKRLCLLFLFGLCLHAVSAQVWLTEVTVNKAGTLSEVLGNRPDTIIALKVNGSINDKDAKLLREMGGFKHFDSPTSLRLLDLSDANLVAIEDDYDGQTVNVDNVVGTSMFGYSWCLMYLALPRNITRMGTATPVHRPQRPAGSTHSSTRGLRPPEQLERPAGFPSSATTRPDSPVPTLQGTCGRSPKRRGSLRFLPPLEVRPSSVAPDPAESRGARHLHRIPRLSEAPWEVP